MARLISRAIAIVLLAVMAGAAPAQKRSVAEREAEWRSYKIPPIEFERLVSAENDVLFRVPASWQKQPSGIEFKAPDGTLLKISVNTIPDGLPLASVVSEMMQPLRAVPGGADSVFTRRTSITGVEAREIMVEFPDFRGVDTRRIIWTAVDKTVLVTYLFVTPKTLVAQTEPLFKAVIDSTVIINSPGEFEYFKALVDSELGEGKPARIDRVQHSIASLESLNVDERTKAVSELTTVFATEPGSCIEYALDRRAHVRAAIIRAMVASGNSALNKFIFDALGDPDPSVAVIAAQAVGKMPDPAAVLMGETQAIALLGQLKVLRAAPFLDEKSKVKLANELFKTAGTVFTEINKLPKPLPPPPPAVPPNKSSTARTTPAPIDPPPPAPAPGTVIGSAIKEPGKEFVAINLLREVPAAVFKLPIEQILKTKDDQLIAYALETALVRRELLPVNLLIELLGSSNIGIRRLAALNLGESAGAHDVLRLNLAIKALSDAKLIAEIETSIKKTELREKIASAIGEARESIIKEALNDPNLGNWVYLRFASSKAEPIKMPADAQASLLGENLFPKDVRLYAALPDPGSSIRRLGDSLSNIQLDSARSQANFALVMASVKARLKQFLGLSAGDSRLEVLGIASSKPIAVATWTAEGAPAGLQAAQRKALLIHVTDRERFERTISLLEGQFSVENLPEIISVGVRLIALMPAVLPVSASAALAQQIKKPEPDKTIHYRIVGRTDCDGHEIKVIERLDVRADQTKRSAVYLGYVGDAAVLAPDCESIRDVLRRITHGGQRLAENQAFQRARAHGGDAIYLSDLGGLFGSPSGGGLLSKNSGVTESGALTLTNNQWKSSYHLSFNDAKWQQFLLPFQPQELSAPREILPASTIVYFSVKADIATLLREFGPTILKDNDFKQLALQLQIDFEKEFVTELAPETSFALLGLPDFQGQVSGVPWLVLFKLKSDKLGAAFREGKLFKGQSAGDGFVRVKLGSSNLVSVIKDGYLALAGDEATLKRLDEPRKLSSSRDFARAAQAAPANVIAFGGYNLEAAIDGLPKSADPATEQLVSVITSLARAFHSQNFFATAAPTGLDASLSVSLDKEGRYPLAELPSQSGDYTLGFAVLEARGVPIAGQRRLERVKLRIRAKAANIVERVKEDLLSRHQTLESNNDRELVLNVKPRRSNLTRRIELPVTAEELKPFLGPTREIRSEDKTVVDKAREIAGKERDAWTVAQKLADWTYTNLKWKRVDNADAATTLATLEADCLEFSQLYIAMARSLGLPARLVTGFAHTGGSFGGHAWVEVFAGDWVELDPTWGTHFVDATHIRESSNDLIRYAALNLVEIEVLEAPHGIAEFQKDPKLLVDKLVSDQASGSKDALETAIDLPFIAEMVLGKEAWRSMKDTEREQVLATYSSLMIGISGHFSGQRVRLLRVEKQSETAQAFLMIPRLVDELLVKLELRLAGEAWVFTEVVWADTEFRIIENALRGVAKAIAAAREGKPQISVMSDHTRLLNLYGEDPKLVLEPIDQLLKTDPHNQPYRYLKALALHSSQRDDDAVKLLEELSHEQPPYAPALLQLATHYSEKDEQSKRKAIDLLTQYAALVPVDPRPYESLATLYDEIDPPKAEAAYRAVIERDPYSIYGYSSLASTLILAKRVSDATAVINLAIEQRGLAKEELFIATLNELYPDREPSEALAAAYPDVLANSTDASLILADLRTTDGAGVEALALLEKTVARDPDNSEVHIAMVETYLSQKNWAKALTHADRAIKIEDESAEAHYLRACALARLGRTAEALRSLKRAIELYPEFADAIGTEEDLKPLARLAEFKKLLPKQEVKDK